MRKVFILSMLLVFLLAGCNFPGTQTAIEQDLVATAVAETLAADSGLVAVTLTSPFSDGENTQEAPATVTMAVPTQTPEPSATPESTQTATATVTVTPTLTNDDPLSWLGNASWIADFGGGDDEGFYTGDDDQTIIAVENDALTMTHQLTTVGWHTWSMNYRTIKNFYFEADVNVKSCSGVDEYGLVFRGPDYSTGYFFAVRCNGEYTLRAYDGEYTNIVYWQYSDAINSGSNQSNRLGVWADDNTFRLYINGKMVKEFTDDTYLDSGHFGFLIAGYETAGFRIEIDRARYWQQ